LGFGQDSIRHYTTNGDFKTPFTGAMGGNVFRWTGTPLYAAPSTAPNGPLFNGGTALTESSFHNESVYTDRKTNSFTAGYVHDRQLSFKFEAKRLEQTGAKLSSASSDMTLLQALTAANAPATGNTNYFKGQGIVTLMSPTNYTTDTFDLGVAWVGDKGHWNASYFASIFKDGYNGLSWDNPYYVSTSTTAPGLTGNTAYPATGMMMNSMGTAPSNDFHQLNLSGGYKFSTSTKLSGSYALGRNTQNQGYAGSYTSSLLGLNGASAVSSLPFNSLNGFVNTTNATARLTHQLNRDLELAAGFRFNERDNQTESGLYGFTNLGGFWRTSATAAYNLPNTSGAYYSRTVNGNITTTVWPRSALAADAIAANPIGSANSANTENYLSIPMSTRRQVLDFAADYKFDSSRKMRFSYEDDRLTRWCKVDPTSNAALASDAEGSYALSRNCAEVPTQNERRLGLNFRQNLGDGSSWSLAYMNSDRRSTVNSNYYNPGTAGMQATTTTTYTNSTTPANSVTQVITVNPYGVVVPGYIAFFQASRKQDMVRAAYNWQVSDNLDLGLRARYGHDSYGDSTFGVQNGRTVGLDFDINFAYSSRHAFAAFVSTQDMRRDMRLDTSTNISDTTNTTVYGNTLKNQDRTVGLSATQTGYFDGKWAFNERITYSNSTTGYSRSTESGATIAVTGNLGNSADAPEIKYETTQLRLGAVYTLTKEDRIQFSYAYQKLRSNDYYYNLYSSVSAVGTNTALPTFQQSPTYQAQMLGVMYSHSFR
jgi:hypothetical protein